MRRNPSKFFNPDLHSRDPLAPSIFEDFDKDFGAPLELLIPYLEKHGILSETPGLVCLCGHPIDAHVSTTRYPCDGSISIQCKCKGPNPILDVEDTRYFFHETFGIMFKHALYMGLDKLSSNGLAHLEFAKQQCAFGSKHNGPLFITALDSYNYISNVSAHADSALCLGCIQKTLNKYDPSKSARSKMDQTY